VYEVTYTPSKILSAGTFIPKPDYPARHLYAEVVGRTITARLVLGAANQRQLL
jgi:hypothetical protein